MSKKKALFQGINIDGFDLSLFNIVERYSFKRSNLAIAAPPDTNENMMRGQVLAGNNYRNLWVNPENNIIDGGGFISDVFDLTTKSGNTIQNWFNSHEDTAHLGVSHLFCEITRRALGKATSTATPPRIKEVVGTEFKTVDGRSAAFPQTQSFGRGQGWRDNLGGSISALDNGNSFSITIIGNNTDLDFQNWGFCSEYNAGGSLTEDKILVGLGTKADKLGAKIVASGTDYDLTFINRIQDSNRHIVTLTVNGSSKLAKLYLDGVFQDSITFSGTYNNNGLLIISRGGTGSGAGWENWRGGWQELNVSNRELNAAEVQALVEVLNL